MKAKLLAFFLLAVFALNVYVIRAVFRAYCEEKEHAEFLFDCTHAQRPEECENVWLSQYAHTEPPWEPDTREARR
jgi:hypothetical protein